MAKGNGSPRLDCSAQFIKYIIVFVNVISLLLGLASIAFGTWLLFDKDLEYLGKLVNVKEFADKLQVSLSKLYMAGITCCVLGGIWFFVSAMGCYGALRHVKCLLGFNSFVLMLILIVQLILAITVIFVPVQNQFLPALQNNYKGNETIASLVMNSVMYNFQCCGLNNSADFEKALGWTRGDDIKIPLSCCKFNNYKFQPTIDIDYSMMTNGSMPGCQQSPNDQNSNWKEGCLGKFTRTLAYYKSVVIGVVAGIDIVLIFCMVFGLYLCDQIGQRSYRYD